jgi:hypothetical protein
MSQTWLSDSGWIASPRNAPMSGPGSALMQRIKHRPAARFAVVRKAEGMAYRSVKATSNELKTGLNIYRMIDLEPV